MSKKLAILFFVSVLVFLVGSQIVLAGSYAIEYGECFMCQDEGFDPVSTDVFSFQEVSFACITCIERVAIEINDTAGCQRIDDNGRLDVRCYAKLAEKNNDPSFCNSFYNENERVRQNGKDDCFGRVAIDLVDANICEKINKNSKKNRCYDDLAFLTGEPNLCERVTEELDPKKGPNDRASCYMSLAQKLDDSSLCDLTAAFKNMCYASVSISMNHSTSIGKRIIIRLVLVVLLIILAVISFLLRRRLPRVLVGSLFGASIFSLIYLSGYLFWSTSFVFTSRLLLLGIPVAIDWIAGLFFNVGFGWNFFSGFDNWLSFISIVVSGGILGYLVGSRINVIVKIILLTLYVIIVGLFLYSVTSFLGSFS